MIGTYEIKPEFEYLRTKQKPYYFEIVTIDGDEAFISPVISKARNVIPTFAQQARLCGWVSMKMLQRI